MSGVYNLKVKQGRTYVMRLNWRDELGATVALAGFTARLVVRQELGYEPALIELLSTGASPAIILGGTPHNIVATFSKAALGIKAGRFVWDLELTSASGADTPLLGGRFEVEGSAIWPIL